MSKSVEPKHRKLWSGLAVEGTTADLAILGIPFDGAASFRRGAAEAPAAIRALTPHTAPFTETGHALETLRICDLGDVRCDGDWDEVSSRIAATVAQAFTYPFAVFLGGDHAVSIPILQTLSETMEGSLGVLHLDAHLDLMDSFEGRRWSHACTARRYLELGNVRPEHVVFCGIRSWLGDEVAYVQSHPALSVHTAQALDAQGVQAVAKQTIAQLETADAVYITLDIDFLDPAFAPGTGTPEAGGPSTRQLLEYLKLVFPALPVRAMDLVEVSPPLDSSHITSVAAVKILYEIFGMLVSRHG